MMRRPKIIMLLIVVAAAVGCTGNASSAGPYGPCKYNDDCRDGDRCIKNWCEDIYNPDREIHQR